jgi:hypothetical protein
MTAISPPVRTVLDLFSTHLPDVRFGDVDASSLARVASDVETAAEVVASAQAALESARVVLHERQEVLLQQVQRALAYARVYAEADEALSAQLEAVSLPRPARRTRADVAAVSVAGASDALVLTSEPQVPRRPRGRPRKVAVASVPSGASGASGESLASVALAEPALLDSLSATGE